MKSKYGLLTDLQCKPVSGAGTFRGTCDGRVRRADILRGVWTVRQLINGDRSKKLVTLASSKQRCYGRHLKRLEKRLGTLGVREVESSGIVGVIEDSKLTRGESSLLHITAKCLFTHACGKRLVNVNPAAGIMVTALLGPRPPVRKRLMLTREELHLVLDAEMRRNNALAIRILRSTGVRGTELFTAKWLDVHLEEGRWHIPASKTGPATDIPLAPIVVDWFMELQQYSESSAYADGLHPCDLARIRQGGKGCDRRLACWRAGAGRCRGTGGSHHSRADGVHLSLRNARA